MKNFDLSPAQLEQEVNVTLPLGALLRLGSPEPIVAELVEGIAVAREPYAARSSLKLPEIGGDKLWGGAFAGVTLDGDAPMALVLLPGEMEPAPWAKAGEWAKERGGVLPSRIDYLVLLKNLRDRFNTDSYYWSSEEVAGNPECAWGQNFSYGTQDFWHKDSEFRGVAVRRVAI